MKQGQAQPFGRAQQRPGPWATAKAVIAKIPDRPIASAGRLLGTVAYVLDRRHRRIVMRNLAFAHAQWSAERIREISRRVFQSTAITLLQILQMTCYSREEVLKRVRILGREHLDLAVQNPRGSIMITAHLGNWEMAALFASCYLDEPMAAVARQLESKRLDQWLNRLRTRFGNTILDKKGALPKMARLLRRGKTLGILIDQGTTRSEGVEVTFFGRKALATPAAALLAQRYGSSVVPGFCVRDGKDRLTLIVEPPLSLKQTKDSRADAQINTQIMTEAIEKAVRTYPEQWFWFHKRWKRHYPELYPEDLARRRRRREKRKARHQKH
jgi:KDO2-lipid IV(A) lauroyltransferase